MRLFITDHCLVIALKPPIASGMRSILFFLLLSLISTAFAAPCFDLCYHYHNTAFARRDVQVLLRSPVNTIMEAQGTYKPYGEILTFRNNLGELHVNANWNQGFSLRFYGQDWGNHNYQRQHTINSGRWIQWACVDKTKFGYCRDSSEELWKKCLEKYS